MTSAASAIDRGVAKLRFRDDPVDPSPVAAGDVMRGHEQVWRLSTHGARTVTVARGHVLVHSGARFDGLHVIGSGSCMLVVTSPDGEEHIASFRLPGEVVGLDALASGVHEATVAALEPLTCWQLPAVRVDDLLQHDPAFARTLVGD